MQACSTSLVPSTHTATLGNSTVITGAAVGSVVGLKPQVHSLLATCFEQVITQTSELQ